MNTSIASPDETGAPQTSGVPDGQEEGEWRPAPGKRKPMSKAARERLEEDYRRYEAIRLKWLYDQCDQSEDPVAARKYMETNLLDENGNYKWAKGGALRWNRKGRGKVGGSVPMSLLIKSDSPPGWVGRVSKRARASGGVRADVSALATAVKAFMRWRGKWPWKAVARFGGVISRSAGFPDRVPMRRVLGGARLPDACWPVLLDAWLCRMDWGLRLWDDGVPHLDDEPSVPVVVPAWRRIGVPVSGRGSTVWAVARWHELGDPLYDFGEWWTACARAGERERFGWFASAWPMLTDEHRKPAPMLHRRFAPGDRRAWGKLGGWWAHRKNRAK